PPGRDGGKEGGGHGARAHLVPEVCGASRRGGLGGEAGGGGVGVPVFDTRGAWGESSFSLFEKNPNTLKSLGSRSRARGIRPSRPRRVKRACASLTSDTRRSF